MNAKRYLMNHRELNFRINTAISEINDLRLKATVIGSFDYSRDRVKTSPSQDAKYVDVVAEIAEREQKLRMQIHEWMRQKEEIEVFLDNYEPMLERDMLRLRYLKYMRLEDIAKELNYSLGTIQNLHSRTMQKLKKRIM